MKIMTMGDFKVALYLSLYIYKLDITYLEISDIKVSPTKEQLFS